MSPCFICTFMHARHYTPTITCPLQIQEEIVVNMLSQTSLLPLISLIYLASALPIPANSLADTFNQLAEAFNPLESLPNSIPL